MCLIFGYIPNLRRGVLCGIWWRIGMQSVPVRGTRNGLPSDSREWESSRFFPCFKKSTGGTTGVERWKSPSSRVTPLSGSGRPRRSDFWYCERQGQSDNQPFGLILDLRFPCLRNQGRRALAALNQGTELNHDFRETGIAQQEMESMWLFFSVLGVCSKIGEMFSCLMPIVTHMNRCDKLNKVAF